MQEQELLQQLSEISHQIAVAEEARRRHPMDRTKLFMFLEQFGGPHCAVAITEEAGNILGLTICAGGGSYSMGVQTLFDSRPVKWDKTNHWSIDGVDDGPRRSRFIDYNELVSRLLAA